jgi:hypothetical protein
MWKNDHFKAKWTVIAKAYSCIRDIVGKQRASLVTFLTLVCPRIGTIIVDNYFGKMNWNLETTAGGTKILKQTSFPDLSYFRADILYKPQMKLYSSAHRLVTSPNKLLTKLLVRTIST